MNNFIVIVLDGLGIGETPDVALSRPNDIGANTLKHIVERFPQINIPNLKSMGILNALGFDSGIENKDALYSRIRFAHEGADTFMGHQEIMGTKPTAPIKHNFTQYIKQVKNALELQNYTVKVFGDDLKYIVVDDCMTVADNVECDLGSAINITGSTELTTFDNILNVSKIVRSIVILPRVIAMGGDSINLENILSAVENPPGFIGVDAPKSGIFNDNYQCVHLGYGVDTDGQLPNILYKNNIKTCFVGKVADLVVNVHGENYSIVPTEKVLKKLLDILSTNSNSFLCANVQETDLSGHSQDVNRYRKILETADYYIGKILEKLDDNDVLIIIADHGNDPTIGHSKHTREYVPLLVRAKNGAGGRFSQQDTLANVAATASEFFNVKGLSYGTSFLSSIFPGS